MLLILKRENVLNIGHGSYFIARNLIDSLLFANSFDISLFCRRFNALFQSWTFSLLTLVEISNLCVLFIIHENSRLLTERQQFIKCLTTLLYFFLRNFACFWLLLHQWIFSFFLVYLISEKCEINIFSFSWSLIEAKTRHYSWCLIVYCWSYSFDDCCPFLYSIEFCIFDFELVKRRMSMYFNHYHHHQSRWSLGGSCHHSFFQCFAPHS